MFFSVTLCTAQVILRLLVLIICFIFSFSEGKLGIHAGETKGVPAAGEDERESG
jgi:hypothetical protein